MPLHPRSPYVPTFIGGPTIQGPHAAMNPYNWDAAATPSWLVEQEEELNRTEKRNTAAINAVRSIQEIASKLPFIGLLSTAFNIPLASLNQKSVWIANERRKLEARRADWYNSPAQQMKRLLKAGVNPYVSQSVHSVPSVVPSVDYYTAPPVSSPDSFSSVMNALTNFRVSDARIANLSSLTDINSYKHDFLLPQLYDRNGYLNNILELQSAWESGNYDKERQIKQNLLDISYRQAVVDLGQGIMENSADIPNSKTYVDVEQGKIYVDLIDDHGFAKTIDLGDVPFKRLPPYLQKIYNDMAVKSDLRTSTVNLNSAQAATTSALGFLYNSRRQLLDAEFDDYKKTGFWRTDDPVLRAMAGVANTSAVWKRLGLNIVDDAAGTLMDVGAAWANPATLGKLFQGSQPAIPSLPGTPQPLKIPRGSTPYIINGQPYYYWK